MFIFLPDNKLKKNSETANLGKNTLDKQIFVIKIWKKVFKVWNMELERAKLSPGGHQAHLPLLGQSDSCASVTSLTVDIVSSDETSDSIVYDFG